MLLQKTEVTGRESEVSEYYEVKCLCGHTRAHHSVDEYACDADGCDCPRFLCLADHPELLKLESALSDVYEGRLMDRDRIDVVIVKLPHNTWQTIQKLWYKAKREGR